MVEVHPIIQGYKCGKCGKVHPYEQDAQVCCKKKKIDWEDIDRFELKQSHLDLLKEANIQWNTCEFGAPEIDPKRPYGNSSVEDDIAQIIKLPKKDNWDYQEEQWKEKAFDYMEDLHRQTQVALQIILHCQSFRLGKYKKEDKYGTDWEYVGE